MDNIDEEQEIIDEPIDDSTADAYMSDWISSIHFDAPLPDWRTEDTWGDPNFEYVPPEYKQYASTDSGEGEDTGSSFISKSNQPVKKKIDFQGLNVMIENPTGTTRHGVDASGKAWQRKMLNDYGYISRSEGLDGDNVDAYMGPKEDAKKVYIVHQKKPNSDIYDEDKCMLGFDSKSDAVQAYLKHYDSTKYFGAVTKVPMDDFKKLLKEEKGKNLIKDAADKIKDNKDREDYLKKLEAEDKIHKSIESVKELINEPQAQ